MSEKQGQLTLREQASLHVLFFILRMLNPTGYEHQIKQLRDETLALLETTAIAKARGDNQ